MIFTYMYILVSSETLQRFYSDTCSYTIGERFPPVKSWLSKTYLVCNGWTFTTSLKAIQESKH